MSSFTGTVSVPRCPVIFDDLNYRDWFQHMCIHMRGQRLWEFLTGELPGPSRPTPPVEPVLPNDASEDDRTKASKTFEDAMETFQTQYAAYKIWIDEDARASAILVASMEVHLTGDIVELASAHAMWTYLCSCYEPSGDSLYLSVVRQEQSLQQGDVTVDEFYAQLSAIWRQIDSLGPDVCRTYRCCQRQQSHMELRRIYDFLTRLRSEFEQTRAQLLARHPRVTLLETLATVRTEEIRLRGAGLLSSSPLPSALVASSASTPAVSLPSSAVSPPVTAAVGKGLHCTYCNKDGHVEQFCCKKKDLHRGARPPRGTGGSSSQLSSGTHDTQQLLTLLGRMVASASSGSDGSAAQSSGERPPSTSSSSGPRPSELYGKFTWRIDNFSQINKRELRSNSFDVGGYKWYILIYPQGCDVCNHLSLFLCVANHDKLLPGWSHFAQFTIAVINRDPKKSKYSDTLHRFWKKEHDWGWKKFMELSKLQDGFVVEDVLTIKAQVQVIREKADRPFRCLDGQYRRELVRVYLSNVEQICRRFIDERRSKLSRLIEDKLRWSSFNAFWLGMDPSVRGHMTREKTDTILKVLVKHCFIEKEVTSTLVMDSLYSGLKALEYQSKNKKGVAKLTEIDARSAPMVLVDQDMFVLADDVILLLERAALDTLPHQPLPTKDDKSSQNRTKDGSSGDDFNKDSIERDDRRLIELGWKTLEFFALAHIFSRIEVAYQEAMALKRQEELIREEEAAGLAEIELKAKRSAAEKEKRIRKKQAKQKKNSRKNNKGKNEKVDIKEIVIQSSLSDRILDDFSSQAEEMTSNADNPEEVSDSSDNRDDNSEVLHIDLEDRESSPVNWETDASETQATVPEGLELQNEQAGKRTSFLDDSSSTCSSDSVPSVILNGSYMGGAWTNVKSSSNRGNNRRNKDSDTRTGLAQGGPNSVPNGIVGSGSNTSGNSNRHEPEDDKVVLQKKQNAQRHVDVTSPSKLRMTESSFSSVSSVKKQPVFSQLPKSSLESTNNMSSRASEVSGAVTASTTTGVTLTPTGQLVSNKGPLSIPATHNERSVPVASRPLQVPAPSKSEAQKQASLVSSATTTQVITVSRPLSAPQVPAAEQTAPVVSTVQAAPLLSCSMSAVGRLGNEPSASAPSYIPRSYRNAMMMEKSSVGASGFTHQTSSSEQGVAQSQSMFASSPSVLSPENSARRDKSSLRPGFTFGTVKPESLNRYQWREESSQQASSSSNSSDNWPLSSSVGNEFEKLNLNGRPRSKQLLSEISTRFTPYQPQGLVGDEFPHLDIINDLLDEEQSDKRAAKVLQQRQQGFARHFSMPNNASTPDYSMFGDPYLFDQSEQYYNEELPRFYTSLNGAPRGLRDSRSYSQFDLPSYSNGQLDDMMMMSQWPYSRTDPSLPSFRADINGYSYQSRDYPNSANGVGRYPSYRPANGH